MSSFEAFGFEPVFRLEVDPEFPGDGDWDCPVFGFDRHGSVMSQFDSRWGTPLVVRVQPLSGPEWVALFAAGGLGSLRGAFATPAPNLAVIIVDGLAYLIDATAPGAQATIVHDQVHQVASCNEPPLLLLVRSIDVVAVGSTGIAWSTPRLCIDDLRVLHADDAGVVCSCDNLEGTATIRLEPMTGAQVEGTRLAELWPPDAFA